MLEHVQGKFIVLMDNFHVNSEAQTLAKTVFAWPGLHKRVRVVGLAVSRWEQLIRLDVFIPLPIIVAQLLNPVERACAELEAGG
jgi:hypothetical protein